MGNCVQAEIQPSQVLEKKESLIPIKTAPISVTKKKKDRNFMKIPTKDNFHESPGVGYKNKEYEHRLVLRKGLPEFKKVLPRMEGDAIYYDMLLEPVTAQFLFKNIQKTLKVHAWKNVNSLKLWHPNLLIEHQTKIHKEVGNFTRGLIKQSKIPVSLQIHYKLIINKECLWNSWSPVTQNLTNLRSLELNFNLQQKLNEKEDFEVCEEIIKGCHNLERLSFFSVSDDSMKIKLLNLITKNLVRLKSLALDLNMKTFYEASSSMQAPIFYGSPSLYNLQSLSINFRRSNHLNSKIIEHLIRSSSSLSDLSLDFSSCRTMNDDFLWELAQLLHKKTRTLQSIWISFKDCNMITDQALGRFILQDLTLLAQLKRLTILLSQHSVIIGDYMATAPSALKFLYLNHLALDLSKTQIKGEAQIFERNFIQRITCLKRLSLSFNGCLDVTGQFLKYLIASIDTHLTQLEYLNLSCIWCREIDDEALKNLIPANPKSLSNLKQLKLGFPWCTKITETGVFKLLLAINKGLLGLRTLQLDFENCPKLIPSKLPKLTVEIRKAQCRNLEIKLNMEGSQQLLNDNVKIVNL